MRHKVGEKSRAFVIHVKKVCFTHRDMREIESFNESDLCNFIESHLFLFSFISLAMGDISANIFL